VSTQLPASWAGLIDDAAIFPPGNASLTDAVAAYAARTDTWYAGLVGAFVVSDLRLPDLLEVLDDATEALPTTVVVSGGAGSVQPAATWATRSGQLDVRGLEIALRDPDDLAGNCRRVVAAVDAARAAGALDDEVPVFVELPHADLSQPGAAASWLRAADVVAEQDFRLKFRTGGLDADLFPGPNALASWIGAALDREVAFKCTAGLHRAVRYLDEEDGVRHHGFLNVLLATRRSLDGDDVPTVAELLAQEDPQVLVDLARETGDTGLASARRWFASYGSCSVDEPLEDLVELGLLEVQG
jgi:hypothetical protein